MSPSLLTKSFMVVMIIKIEHVNNTFTCRLPSLTWSLGIWWMITWDPTKSLNTSFLGGGATLEPERARADLGFVPNAFF